MALVANEYTTWRGPSGSDSDMGRLVVWAEDTGQRQIDRYESVPVELYALQQAIASKLPVIIGVSVYESFEGDDVGMNGDVPMPSTSEKLLGGHAMLVCGYDDAAQYFTVRNQWGMWGDHGYLYLPYAYLSNPQLSGDFWVLRSVEG